MNIIQLEQEISESETVFVNGSNNTFSLQDIWEQSKGNASDRIQLNQSLKWTIFLILAHILVVFIGTVGNLIVILVIILKKREMRSVTNTITLNLAVADLFLIIICVVPSLLSKILKRT